jgi:hypothetical protein
MKSSENKVNLIDLKPADTPDYMLSAWIGCLHWALGDPKVLADFRAETGNQWTPGRTPIDRMIDQSTGADRQFIIEFVKWANVHVWGPIEDVSSSGEPIEDEPDEESS